MIPFKTRNIFLTYLEAYIKSNDKLPAHIQESLEFYHRDLDPKENNKLKLPPNEKIRTHCIWVMEAYPPSHIDNLFKGLEQLKWTSSKPDDDGKKEYIKWIEEQRKRLWGGGSLNLGYLKSDKVPKSAIPFVRTADIPQNVHSIKGSVLQFIPSMTIVVFQFIFNDQAASHLEEPFIKYHSTFTERINNVYRFILPSHQKLAEIEIKRKLLYLTCSDWIQTYLPGLFSKGILNGEFPVAEFTTFKETTPFEIKYKGYDHYMAFLSLSNEWDTLQSNDLPGIYLTMPSRKELDFSKIYFSGKFDNILIGKDLKAYGGHTSTGITHWLGYLDYTLGVWTISVIWKAYERNLGVLRDKIANIQMNHIKKDALELRTLEREYIDLNINFLTSSNELKEFCGNKSLFHHETYDFCPIPESLKNHQLIEGIRERLQMKIDQIKVIENSLGQVIETCTHLMNTISNEKVSNRTFFLQYIMIAMTIAMLVLSFLNIIVILKNPENITINNIISHIKDVLNKIY